jgi:hypothetical protein
MSDTDAGYFLVVYDIPTAVARVHDLGSDHEAALAAYCSIEDETGDRDDLDVVLLAADSLETIKRTHSSYFGSEESFESLLPEGLLS